MKNDEQWISRAISQGYVRLADGRGQIKLVCSSFLDHVEFYNSVNDSGIFRIYGVSTVLWSQANPNDIWGKPACIQKGSSK